MKVAARDNTISQAEISKLMIVNCFNRAATGAIYIIPALDEKDY